MLPGGRTSGDHDASSSGSALSVEQSNPCPICLEPIKEEAYLDRCFHAFCYICIAQWTKIVSSKHTHRLSYIKCPLCKTENFSILHGLRNNYFKRHYVKHGPDNSQTSFPSRDHVFRRQCYDSNPGILYLKFNVQRYWQDRHYLKQNKWLEQWLRREIQTLTMVEDVDVVVHHILGVVEDFMKRQLHEISRGTYKQKREEFKILVADAAKPFVSEWAMRFVDELELFLASCLNPEAYDKLYVEAMSSSGSVSTQVSVVEEPLLFVSDEDVDNN